MLTVADYMTSLTAQLATFQSQYTEASKMSSDVKGKSIGSSVSAGAIEGTVTRLQAVVNANSSESDFATRFLPKLTALPRIPNIFSYTTNAQRATAFAQYTGVLTNIRWEIMQAYAA